MKKLTKELKSKTIDKLKQEAQEIRTEMAKIRLETKTNPTKDTNLLIKKRTRLAVILTNLNEKQELKDLENEEIKGQKDKNDSN